MTFARLINYFLLYNDFLAFNNPLPSLEGDRAAHAALSPSKEK
jgi:hypothetical protein